MPPPDPDLESSWQALGRPSKFEKAVKAVPEKTMTFLEFIFTWIGKAWDAVWGKFFEPALWLILGGVLATAFVGYGLWKSVTTSDAVEFCYIEKTGMTEDVSVSVEGKEPKEVELDVYRLRGSVDWGQDRNIFEGTDYDELIEVAKKTGCPLK